MRHSMLAVPRLVFTDFMTKSVYQSEWIVLQCFEKRFCFVSSYYLWNIKCIRIAYFLYKLNNNNKEFEAQTFNCLIYATVCSENNTITEQHVFLNHSKTFCWQIDLESYAIWLDLVSISLSSTVYYFLYTCID